MAYPRIEETTLYPPIIKLLQELGFEAIGNTIVEDVEPDILFRYGSLSFVIEVKVGKPELVGLKAVAQAYDYGTRLKTPNIIILIYPDSIRKEAITDYEIVRRIALNANLSITTLTDLWTETVSSNPTSFFQQLKRLIDARETKIDFATTVKLIERYASDLNSVVFKIRTDELVSEVVNKLDLFVSIGEIKDKEVAKKQVTNLASFLLFNQLLFYHIYKRKAKFDDDAFFDLEEIKHLQGIKTYFDKITDIDYKSIYSVNLLAHIPETKDVIEILNEVIKAIKLLRAEYITHDLAGRFFHDLIPFEVRKILAAFYTHPASADLLTGLAIDKWSETLIDPACGSGTLLVSSYNRKRDLYQEEYGDRDLAKIHRKFVEDDITGIDIMPFAAHISAINLTMQSIEEKTNIVRIATQDSLELAEVLDTTQFKRGKYVVKPYSATIQKSLVEEDNDRLLRKKGSVSSEGRGSAFPLRPVDLVIMNPPFSDREKMPREMRDKLNSNTLRGICGNQVNLWGYFLALGDKLLKSNGKIAAVIPINIARGRATRLIREFILRNYKAKFFVKPLKDRAFSEGSSFKDLLYIARKGKPESIDYTGIVTLKKSIREMSEKELKELTYELNSCYLAHRDESTNQFEVKFIKTLSLNENSDNLMPLIGFTSYRNKNVLDSFLQKVRSRSNGLLMKIPRDIISEGFHASPAGLSELVFITRSTDKARVERAFLVLKNEYKTSVGVELGNGSFSLEIPYSAIKPALRTLTAVKTFNPESIDYILVREPQNFNRILAISKWKGQFNWIEHEKNVAKKESYVVVGRRFRPNSGNTHHFAFYSSKKIVAPDTFKNLNFKSEEEAFTQTLLLNSSITIANILSYREQTTGGFTDIRESELISFDILNFDRLDDKRKFVLKTLFERLKKFDFPSILEQYVKNIDERRLLDSTVLEILGLDKNEANEIIDDLYPIIAEELQAKG
jgi:type I restriction-modification system DNA methylase subunit